jgi:hypothetical protein
MSADPVWTLERAAKLMRENGKAKGEFWPADSLPWDPPLELDMTAAIGVALGARSTAGVSKSVVGCDSYAEPSSNAERAHPAFRGLLRYLGLRSGLELFEWNDSHTCEEAIAALLGAADMMREEATT